MNFSSSLTSMYFNEEKGSTPPYYKVIVRFAASRNLNSGKEYTSSRVVVWDEFMTKIFVWSLLYLNYRG